jgi:type VI secretion system protein ImpH
MPSPQRRPEPGVIDLLLAEPHRAEFFQAVSLIERWLEQNGVERGRALLDYLRFPNRLSVAFPPSQIAALTVVADAPVGDAAALLTALQEGSLQHISLTPAFMGFLGGNGTLPLHYTQRIADHEHRTGDDGPRAFLDLFSQRSVTLFYQAWTKHRPGHMRDADGEDCLLPILLALAGTRPREAQRDAPAGIDEDAVAFYAAQFRGRATSGGVLAGVLSEYFGVPFALEQFVGAWRPIPFEQRARLGVGNTNLGVGMVLGSRVYCRDTRARLRIGPLDKEAFERFIPGASATRALEKMLGMFCGVGLTFEVRVVLRKEDVRGLKLSASGCARLGIDAFLLTKAQTTPRDGAIYLLHP